MLVVFKDTVYDQLWFATVDDRYKLMHAPAFDPPTCWVTHGALCATRSSQLPPKPRCWDQIVREATRLGSRLSMFVRLDFYADEHEGALVGEVTLFPHILNPRKLYSSWANELLQSEWRGLDGCDRADATVQRSLMSAFTGPGTESNVADAPADLFHNDARHNARNGPKVHALPGIQTGSTVVAAARAPLTSLIPDVPAAHLVPSSWTSLPSMLSSFDGDGAWAISVRGGKARAYTRRDLIGLIDRLELGRFGVRPSERVAILLPNGAALAVCLLAVIARYTAVPLDIATPPAAVAATIATLGVRAVLVLSEEPENDGAVEGAVQSAVESAVKKAVEKAGNRTSAPHLEFVRLTLDETQPCGVALSACDRSCASESEEPEKTRAAVAAAKGRVAATTKGFNTPDQTVLFLRTSGTTGTSKTVPYTLHALMRAGRGVAASMELSAKDVALSMLPLHHIGARRAAHHSSCAQAVLASHLIHCSFFRFMLAWPS
eukprot:1448235-Pleurochrysis_carterae.AAC.1